MSKGLEGKNDRRWCCFFNHIAILSVQYCHIAGLRWEVRGIPTPDEKCGNGEPDGNFESKSAQPRGGWHCPGRVPELPVRQSRYGFTTTAATTRSSRSGRHGAEGQSFFSQCFAVPDGSDHEPELAAGHAGCKPAAGFRARSDARLRRRCVERIAWRPELQDRDAADQIWPGLPRRSAALPR